MGFLTVYILAPILGAITGAGLYLHVIRTTKESSILKPD
jgi:hypothetical protein